MTPPSAPDAGLRERFAEEARLWRFETAPMTHISERYENQHMQNILDMGSPAIPLILDELRKHGGHWFTALWILTGAKPVPAEDQGRVAKMREHWLNWGVEQGYLQPPETAQGVMHV